MTRKFFIKVPIPPGQTIIILNIPPSYPDGYTLDIPESLKEGIPCRQTFSNTVEPLQTGTPENRKPLSPEFLI